MSIMSIEKIIAKIRSLENDVLTLHESGRQLGHKEAREHMRDFDAAPATPAAKPKKAEDRSKWVYDDAGHVLWKGRGRKPKVVRDMEAAELAKVVASEAAERAEGDAAVIQETVDAQYGDDVS